MMDRYKQERMEDRKAMLEGIAIILGFIMAGLVLGLIIGKQIYG